ncbi:protein of unknown function [Agreia sp. COWG]|nr:protein of unknown function [Agreia sp. COWG]
MPLRNRARLRRLLRSAPFGDSVGANRRAAHALSVLGLFGGRRFLSAEVLASGNQVALARTRRRHPLAVARDRAHRGRRRTRRGGRGRVPGEVPRRCARGPIVGSAARGQPVLTRRRRLGLCRRCRVAAKLLLVGHTPWPKEAVLRPLGV